MAQIFYTREKKEKKVPVYDFESKDIGIKPFLNLFEKLINPTVEVSWQRQKGLSFLCYFLAGLETNISVH